ncbi:hypothetical protein Taro_021877 [Colocasia esculenta]|uniref:Uncharacterized protein n=1 Tax=Colocasia esculenta TaxID=4460 RepID=A0A843V2E7_COLES|nr:hypothetical protein [Colocasia esculenta]
MLNTDKNSCTALGRVPVKPARRVRTCAIAKETYGGLDKESLVQSGVFPMERWSMPRESV